MANFITKKLRARKKNVKPVKKKAKSELQQLEGFLELLYVFIFHFNLLT